LIGQHILNTRIKFESKQMKNNIILSLIIFILLYKNNYAQEITPEQKQQYIQVLSDSTSDSQFYALLSVIDNNILDAEGTIQQNFWRYSRFHQTLALKALYKLNSDLTLEYANRLIDTLNNNPDDFNLYGIGQAPDILTEKVVIANIMFSLNDFSQVSCIFELIDRDSIQEVSDIVIDPLIKIMQNVPSYSEQAKNKLIDLVYSSNDLFTRSNALIALEKSIGIESLPIILQSFQSDSSDVNRYYILNEFLGKYSENIDLSGILRERIYTEPAGSLRLRIAKILLYGPGGISNYNFIRNYINDESDEMIKEAITFEVEENIPRLFYEDSTLIVILDSLISVTNQVHIINWLGDLAFSNELKNILTTAKTNLQNGDSIACRVQVKAFQDFVDNVYKDSLNADPRFVTIEGWKFLYWNAQYIIDRLPEPLANPNLVVNLKNSLGNQILASNVQYYEGSWKDAVNNRDGTFTVITTKPTVSIRVYYEYASLQADNVNAQNNTYTFTTVNAAVQLKNSLGNLIDQGIVQYYAGAWRSFGTTSNGVAYKELLPINYSFRMTYEYGSIDKQQNLSSDPTVVFQTVNASVQLKNSLGNFIDQGIVQYYAGAWRSLGTTNSSGIAKKELLPANISFRATVGNVSLDKQQDISVNNLVEILLNTP